MMTVFDWLEALSGEMYWILAHDAWNSVLMGALSIVVASVALFFNHYDWRRARVLSAMTVVYITGWYFINLFVFGDSLNKGTPFGSVALTVLLCMFIIVGYWVAGVISSLKSNPVILLKMKTAERLKLVASFLESTVMDSTPVKRVHKEQEAMRYIQEVATKKVENG